MSRLLLFPLFALAACASEPEEDGQIEPSAEAEAAAEAGPEEVLTAYYDAIANREYQTAWELWGNEPERDREFDDFVAGFENTELTAVELGLVGEEAIRGRYVYVDIPVVVEDFMSDGSGKRYKGVYTLRRIAGSDEDWRIHAGNLNEVPTDE